MTDVLTKRENVDTEKHTGRTEGEHKDRDQGDVSIGQGMPMLARKPSEARRSVGLIHPRSPQEQPVEVCCSSSPACGTLLWHL